MTYQLASEQQYGTAYKISPETTEEELNVMKCFQINGTKDEAVTPQAALPDVQGFQVCVLFLFIPLFSLIFMSKSVYMEQSLVVKTEAKAEKS